MLVSDRYLFVLDMLMQSKQRQRQRGRAQIKNFDTFNFERGMVHSIMLSNACFADD